MNQPQLIYGTDYIKAGMEKILPLAPGRVAGITPGKKQSLRRKHDANEDCLARVPTPDGELLLAADSHFGSLASKVCIEQFAPRFAAGSGDPTRRLLRVHFQLDDAVREAKSRPEAADQRACATTLVSVLLQGERLYYASTGDSRLWLVRDGELRDVLGNDDLSPLFLGDEGVHLFRYLPRLEDMGCVDVVTEREVVVEVLLRLHEIHRLVKTGAPSDAVAALRGEIEKLTSMDFPVSLDELMESWHRLHLELPSTLPQAGSVTVRAGDVVLLATDGIDEEESGCDTDRVAALLTESRPLEKRAARLLSACMGRNGGNDNIAFLAMEI